MIPAGKCPPSGIQIPSGCTIPTRSLPVSIRSTSRGSSHPEGSAQSSTPVGESLGWDALRRRAHPFFLKHGGHGGVRRTRREARRKKSRKESARCDPSRHKRMAPPAARFRLQRQRREERGAEGGLGGLQLLVELLRETGLRARLIGEKHSGDARHRHAGRQIIKRIRADAIDEAESSHA